MRVLIVEPTMLGSQSLAAALERNFEVVYAGTSPGECRKAIATQRADVALISDALDELGVNAFDFTLELRNCCPWIRVVMMVDTANAENVIKAFRSGARGVFGRDSSLELLSKCVQRVHRGEVWASIEAVQHLVAALTQPPRLHLINARGTELLAPREQEVVHWVAEGLTNREIADRLALSENTVKNYLFRIFDKLGVSSRVELILYAASHAAKDVRTGGETELPEAKATFESDELRFQWCRQAVEKFGLVHYLLATLYATGKGVRADKTVALKWYAISEGLSAEFLQKSRDARAQLEQELCPDKIANARMWAAEWLAQRNPFELARKNEPKRAS